MLAACYCDGFGAFYDDGFVVFDGDAFGVLDSDDNQSIIIIYLLYIII